MGGQPLSRVAPDADLDLAARVMDTEPELASLAMRVIASWSYVEYWMTRLLAVFLKTDYGVAHAMMTGIVSSEARWGALDAATYALDDADRILYDRAIHAAAGPHKIRRKYAHHLWTISRTVPDALILVDPQYMVGYHAANLERNAQLNR